MLMARNKVTDIFNRDACYTCMYKPTKIVHDIKLIFVCIYHEISIYDLVNIKIIIVATKWVNQCLCHLGKVTWVNVQRHSTYDMHSRASV